MIGAVGFAAPAVGADKVVTASLLSLAGAHAANYRLGDSNAMTTADILPALLTLTADPLSRYYGATNPVLTFTTTGFVVGETWGIAGIAGDPVLSTPAVINSPAGDYPITVAIGSLTATNYSFALQSGLLSVLPWGKAVVIPTMPPAVPGLRLLGKGDPGVEYTIQVSSNLVIWVTWTNVTAGPTGHFEVDDAGAPLWGERFYRAVLP